MHDSGFKLTSTYITKRLREQEREIMLVEGGQPSLYTLRVGGLLATDPLSFWCLLARSTFFINPRRLCSASTASYRLLPPPTASYRLLPPATACYHLLPYTRLRPVTAASLESFCRIPPPPTASCHVRACGP